MADQNTTAETPIADKVAEAVAADVPAQAKADKPAASKIDAAVEAVKQEKAKPAKRKAAARKKAAPKKAVKKAAPKAKKPAATKFNETSKKTKEPKMATKKTTTKTNAADQMTGKAKEMFADLSTRAQGAYDNAREYAGEAVEFSKGNVEAMVNSGKILGEGLQGMAKGAVDTGRDAVETMTADAKEFAAVRSPSELVQLNSKIASRNFDAMVAQTSKNVEAWTKLATDAFAPIQDRVSIAVEKARKVA